MFKASELVALAVALIVLPSIALVSGRMVFPAGRMAFRAGYLCVVAGMVFTVAEGIPGLPGAWLNTAEHVSFAAAGVAFCIGAWGVRTAVLAEGTR